MNHDLLYDFPYHVELQVKTSISKIDVTMLSENLEFISAACDRLVDGRKQSKQRLVETPACQRQKECHTLA